MHLICTRNSLFPEGIFLDITHHLCSSFPKYIQSFKNWKQSQYYFDDVESVQSVYHNKINELHTQSTCNMVPPPISAVNCQPLGQTPILKL